MTEDTEKRLAEVHAVAALAYKRACEAFQIATDAHRASVMAYGLAMRVSDDDQFDAPPNEPVQPPPELKI